jgi:geranylgeranyl diphosphate synthase, type II
VRSAGRDPALALPVAAALELVHTFSLVHDDLPALDDDRMRRGRPTSHVRYGEAVAVLVGDGLLNAAFRLVVDRLDAPAEVRAAVVSEMARGVAGMIDGQYLDVTAPGQPTLEELARLHRLKTGALISASVGCGLLVAEVDQAGQQPYRALAEELGLLFQIVDDILDAGREGEPSYVGVLGIDRARELSEASYGRARDLLARIPGEASELTELTELIGRRTS